MSRTRYVPSGGLRIAYELCGTMSRRPWLVLIQGMGFDRLGWEPVLGNCGAASGWHWWTTGVPGAATGRPVRSA